MAEAPQIHDTPTIQRALAAVMADVQAVGKNQRNEQQKFMFRGVDAVVNAVGPALREHGVIVLPKVLDKRYRDFNTKNGALMHEAVLEVEFTFVGPAGDTLVASAVGESADSGDKASAKAHPVAFRTVLLQALCIPTDDPDPDASTYERTERSAPATRVCPVCEGPIGDEPVAKHQGEWAHKECAKRAAGGAS
jgi:hypothetical protein